MRKPRLVGVPTRLTDHWLAGLKAGNLAPHDQRELHKVLLHKWSGKGGVPDLTVAKTMRQIEAGFIEGKVQNEIRRLKANGKPSPGGYRAEALEIVAKAHGRTPEYVMKRLFENGETLGRWLRRNHHSK